MKTNHLMLRDLLRKYNPRDNAILFRDERELIEQTLCLHEMDNLALHNLRDFVVVSMKNYDDSDAFFKMSAIVACIDEAIIDIGGTV